jgi:hypothetical protein
MSALRPLLLTLLLAAGCAQAQDRAPATPLADGAQLTDMGALADAAGRGAHWWVESRGPDLCAPRTLHVLVDVHMPLAREGVAREWMQLAHQRWAQLCPGKTAGGLMVRIQLHQGFELAPDAAGYMPRGVVNALASFQGQGMVFQQYQSNAASLPPADGEHSPEYAANARRLRQFAQRYKASRVMDVAQLDRLRTRPHATVLLAVRPGALVGRGKRLVHGARHEGWDASSAVAEGADVAKWGTDSRMLAVRVKARSTDVRTPDRWVLAVLGSQVCQSRDCEDFLLLQGGQWASGPIPHALN